MTSHQLADDTINLAAATTQEQQQSKGIPLTIIDLEHIKDNVADRIKLPSHEKKDIEPFSQEEVIKLLNNANEWFRLYLAISFYTGMRTGEVMALTRSDIDLDDRVYTSQCSVICTGGLFCQYFGISTGSSYTTCTGCLYAL